ncbi:GlpG protein (membrane protein of glp regulon) [Streptococcus pneumoniae]|nr:GlpG protein (membrane protein of glp regulon) [Streptococcus pneumoniae]
MVTFGVFQAGTTNNVITDTAFLHGTIRALTQDMSLLVQKRVKTVAEGVAAAFDMEVEVELKQGGYLPVENNPALACELMDFFDEKDGIELIDIEPAMTGEDFGYLLSKVDGVMFWLGIDSPYALHHPQMSPKEEVLAIGVAAVSSFLKKKAAE